MDAAYTPLSRDIVEVSGPDRDDFLQGLISQDIAKVTPARSAYGALLSPQGKYLHDFCLAEFGESIWLDCEGGRGADLAKRLSIFRLRSKVTITLREDLAVRAVFGPDAASAMDLGANAGEAAVEESLVRFVDPRTADLGVRLIGPADALTAALEAAGIPEAPFAHWDRLRISLTVPDGTRDMEPDRSILLESNFEALNGVDWQKGCYMGQELTARTKYRGLVKRRLVAVAIEGGVPGPGSAMTVGSRTIGELRSVSGDLALATVRVDALQHEKDLLVSTDNGEILRILADNTSG